MVRLNDQPISSLTHGQAHEELMRAGNNFVLGVLRLVLCLPYPNLSIIDKIQPSKITIESKYTSRYLCTSSSPYRNQIPQPSQLENNSISMSTTLPLHRRTELTDRSEVELNLNYFFTATNFISSTLDKLVYRPTIPRGRYTSTIALHFHFQQQ